jgi:hypothetical protein
MLAQELASRTSTIVTQTDGLCWRVRRLRPSDIGIMPKLMSALAGMLATPDEQPGMSPEEAVEIRTKVARERLMALTAEELMEIDAYQERIVMHAVVAASSDDGKTWEKIQLVAPNEEDPAASRVSVSILDATTRGLIYAAATVGIKEAGERVRPFRAG